MELASVGRIPRAGGSFPPESPRPHHQLPRPPPQAEHAGGDRGAATPRTNNRQRISNVYDGSNAQYEDQYEEELEVSELRPLEPAYARHDRGNSNARRARTGEVSGCGGVSPDSVGEWDAKFMVQKGPDLRRSLGGGQVDKAYQGRTKVSGQQAGFAQLRVVDERHGLQKAEEAADVLSLHGPAGRDASAPRSPDPCSVPRKGRVGGSDVVGGQRGEEEVFVALRSLGFTENYDDNDSFGLQVLIEQKLPIWTSDLKKIYVDKYLGCWTANGEVNLWLLQGDDGKFWCIDDYKQAYQMDNELDVITAFLRSCLDI